MPFITPYGKGRFRCHIQKLGVRESRTFDKKREALEWGVLRERQIEAEQKGIGVTFAQATARYLRDVSPKKKDAVEWETRRMAAFCEHFGEHTPLLTIKQPQIAKWRDHRLETVTGSTVNREANLLSNLFRKCRLEWHWMEHNPMEGVEWPEDEEPRETVWHWTQIRRVLRYCQTSQGVKTQQAGIAFHIALRTGMRAKEVLLAFRRGNVCVINDSKTTKRGKLVDFPLTHQGRRVMDRYANTPWQVQPNELSVLFHKACIGCGVRQPKVEGPTFHDARATALTLMARKMPVEQLQRISRHRKVQTLLDHYYRETNEQIAARL
jgi:integrase